MERRLLKAIINPAMIATWVLGLGLAWGGGWFAFHWLQAGKLVLVLAAIRGCMDRFWRAVVKRISPPIGTSA